MKPLYTKSGLPIAIDFVRIEHGGRGDYYEIAPEMMVMENIHIPEKKKWKQENNKVDYLEYRSNRDNVKIYCQVNTQYVDYAEYKVNFFYVSVKSIFTQDHSLMKYLEV
ncbi:MAG: hypothetical protein ACFFAS_20325 [Promethearchaeota archaeon]